MTSESRRNVSYVTLMLFVSVWSRLNIYAWNMGFVN
jgi:hypothetical protein